MTRDESGSASVLVILMLPVLLLMLAGVLELGALRMLAARARAAGDLATIIAVNDQDQAELERTGRLRLASDAEDVARAYFAANLEGLGEALGADATAIAASADIAVYPDAPAVDPRLGVRYDRPTVRIWSDVPLRAPLLGSILGTSVVPAAVRAASSAR